MVRTLFTLTFVLFWKFLAAQQPPNVLLIYVDDLNDRLGCYGDPVAQTPYIDQLAAEGTLFKRPYCQQALCAPSRASTLTGLLPCTLGVLSLKEDFRKRWEDHPTLPELFRQNGYFTARVGKVFHQGVPDAIAQQSPGADVPEAWDKAIDVPGYELNNNGYYYNATPWQTHQVGASGAVAWLRAEKGDERHHDYNVATEVIQLMEEAKDQPFFLAAGFIRPHVPLVAPKRYFQRFDGVDIQPIPVPATDREDMPKIAYDTWAGHFNLPETERREAMRAYYACTAFVDDQVGRLVGALKNLDLYDNTIIVLVSEHGLWFKNFLFRESAIAPMIIRHPDIPQGTVEEVVELLDLYPTLAKMAKLNAPANLEGQDMTALMQGQPQDWKNFAIVETRHQGVVGKAIYTPEWSYMDWGGHGQELYDLRKDPNQWNNLNTQEEYSSVMQALQEKIKE
jgi:uncharacterized sulfatase